MSNDPDIFGDNTDKWGFSRYSIVLHATTELTEQVMDFRRAIGLSDLATEPHVSLLAGLFQPIDLAEIEDRLRQVAGSQFSQAIRFDDPPFAHNENSGCITVVPTQQLTGLRSQLQAVCNGLIRSGGDPAKPFRPHLTLYQGASETEAALARKLIDRFDFGAGFEASSLDLVGRVGSPRGGTRTIIASCSLKPR